MRSIILAAGQGTRLRPLTNNKPKCMVEFNGTPIIDHILNVMGKCGISDVAVVNGYKKNILEEYLSKTACRFFHNERFDQTNMVSTLFCAREFMDDDVIISYADIVYSKEVLDALIASKGEVNVVVDKSWKNLWDIRMDNPLDDVETLKIKDGNIVELGKKAKDYSEIEAQYIGLIKISKSAMLKVIEFYGNLNKNDIYDGKDFDNMYMTTLIQLIINNLMDVTPVFINGGWIEVDSVEDLLAYKQAEVRV